MEVVCRILNGNWEKIRKICWGKRWNFLIYWGESISEINTSTSFSLSLNIVQFPGVTCLQSYMKCSTCLQRLRDKNETLPNNLPIKSPRVKALEATIRARSLVIYIQHMLYSCSWLENYIAAFLIILLRAKRASLLNMPESTIDHDLMNEVYLNSDDRNVGGQLSAPFSDGWM